MTVEAIIALSTAALALANGIWAHRRISVAKVQAPVTKAELYGVTTRGGIPAPILKSDVVKEAIRTGKAAYAENVIDDVPDAKHKDPH